MPAVPQIAFPVRVDPVTGDFAVVEQDSPDDVAGCVQIILRYPLQYLPWLPEFGTANLAFRQITDDIVEDVRTAVAEWEPRCNVLTEDQFADAIRTVILTLLPA